MILHVDNATHIEDYRIRIEFDDGVVKEVDLRTLRNLAPLSHM